MENAQQTLATVIHFLWFLVLGWEILASTFSDDLSFNW